MKLLPSQSTLPSNSGASSSLLLALSFVHQIAQISLAVASGDVNSQARKFSSKISITIQYL